MRQIIVASFAAPLAVIIPHQEAAKVIAAHASYQSAAQQNPIIMAWQWLFPDSVAFFTFCLVASTILLWRATMRIGRDSRNSGVTQAEKMERSAVAMEGVKESMAINAKQIVKSVKHQEMFGKMQMRAYVSVLLDERPVYQDANCRFQARPTIRNTGHTPAKRLRWRIRGAIERVPLPLDFDFSLPGDRGGENILMPQAVATLDFFLPGRLVDELVPDVMRGFGWGFYVWGIVSYEDAFGDPHETKFAHIYNYVPTNEVREDGAFVVRYDGSYLAVHNEAN